MYYWTLCPLLVSVSMLTPQLIFHQCNPWNERAKCPRVLASSSAPSYTCDLRSPGMMIPTPCQPHKEEGRSNETLNKAVLGNVCGAALCRCRQQPFCLGAAHTPGGCLGSPSPTCFRDEQPTPQALLGQLLLL